MQLSTKGRYAVMAMVDLAAREVSDGLGVLICLADIAQRQQLSRRIWSSFSASCGGPGW